MKLPSAESVLEHLIDAAPCALQDLPRGKIGIYALIFPSDRIVQIGSVGQRSANEDFRSRILSRHRSGSEGEHHKASAAFNVGRMYRHVERFRRTPSSKIRLQPRYGHVMGFEQTERSAEVAKKLRNEVVSRCVTATWFAIDRTTSVSEFEVTLNVLEEEVRDLYGIANLPWHGKADPVEEPGKVVEDVVRYFKVQGTWGSGSKTLPILGDEEDLLENQARIWRAVSTAMK